MENTNNQVAEETTVRQNIINFGPEANALRLKKTLFDTPEKALQVLEGISSPLAEELRWTVQYLIALSQRLNEIKDSTVSKGFAYSLQNGSLARNITDSTFEFTPEQVKKLNTLSGEMQGFYEDRIRLLQQDSSIQELFGITDTSIIDNLEVPLFTRLDLLLDLDGTMKIAEMEPIYAGIGECMGTREVFQEAGVQDENFPGLDASYLEAMKRFEGKRFLFLPNSDLPGYYKEVAFLYNKLSSRADAFCNMDICFDTDNVDIREDGLYFEEQRVDILMNYFISKEQGTESEFDQKVKELFKRGKIKLFPEPSLELDSKLWLALVGETRYFPEDYPIKEFVPDTKIVSSGKDIGGEGVFTKRVISRIGEKDVLLGTIEDEKMEEILADSVPWIAQREVEGETREIIQLTRKGRIEKQEMFARIELYVFFGKRGSQMGDVLVTMGPNKIVKGGKSTVMIPGTTLKTNNI